MSAKGLLLINLGSPRAPTVKEVKAYLHEFLCDKYVIDIPAPLRYALVYGLITPLRAARSAAAYQKIWTSQGSPLTVLTRKFASAVAESLPGWQVRWGMRYGEYSIKTALKDWSVDDLYIIPLYPQYAESSSRTAIEAALSEVRRKGSAKRVFVLENFHAEREYLEAQAAVISTRIAEFKPDRLLLSYHGLPEHHLTKLHSDHCFVGDGCCASLSEGNRQCYRAQAFATTAELRKLLPLPAEKVQISFQSRLGRRPWIKPYTDLLVSEMAASGVKRLLVSCPSFVADCLETLEEVEIRLKQQFLSEGGEALMLTPALNAEKIWVGGFCKMVSRQNLSWRKI